jgi:hypothetical protein
MKERMGIDIRSQNFNIYTFVPDEERVEPTFQKWGSLLFSLCHHATSQFLQWSSFIQVWSVIHTQSLSGSRHFHHEVRVIGSSHCKHTPRNMLSMLLT